MTIIENSKFAVVQGSDTYIIMCYEPVAFSTTERHDLSLSTEGIAADMSLGREATAFLSRLMLSAHILRFVPGALPLG